jgi:hypothetical protein
MRIFIERFVLAILAALAVLLAVTNPMGFSWPRRIVGVAVIVVVAGIAAHIAGWEERRWERLRGMWWLWTIFGLSSGVALALWLTPLFIGPPTTIFDPDFLTSERQETFRQATYGLDNLGAIVPRKVSIIAEDSSSSVARKLVDLFIIAGFQPEDHGAGRGGGRGDYVGTPQGGFRLAPGITVSAPVPSAVAEAVHCAFERIGVVTRRTSDRSRVATIILSLKSVRRGDRGPSSSSVIGARRCIPLHRYCVPRRSSNRSAR